MKGLRLSMERFGYLTPIVVDQNNLIADGEHRALVYKEFGLTEIPAYRVVFSDDTERRLLRQTMNKLRGMHDQQLDADEMALIYESNKLPDLSGLIAQQEATIKELMLRYRPELPFGHEDDAQIDQIIDEQLKKTAPDTQLGDIYQLGNHRLICADCTDKRSVDRLFEDKQPDIILTDPPYSSGGAQEGGRGQGSIGTRAHEKIRADNLSTKGYLALIKQAISDVNADILYLFTDWRMWSWAYDTAESSGYPVKNMLVWDKQHFGLGSPWRTQHELILFAKKSPSKLQSGKCGNVLAVKKVSTSEREHPTTKPIELLKRILDNTEGQAVYDPFLGSGSTMIACEQTGRHCYGVEIDPHYVDICCKRWESYTGQKALKL